MQKQPIALKRPMEAKTQLFHINNLILRMQLNSDQDNLPSGFEENLLEDLLEEK